MSDLTDLGRRLDRTSYDLAKSLVKLDEAQQHPAMLPAVIAETQKRLADLQSIVGQIERLEVLQETKNA